MKFYDKITTTINIYSGQNLFFENVIKISKGIHFDALITVIFHIANCLVKTHQTERLSLKIIVAICFLNQKRPIKAIKSSNMMTFNNF